MTHNIWQHYIDDVGRDNYYESVYTLDEFEALARRIDMISEYEEIDLKDGYSICYIHNVTDRGIHCKKILPCGDTTKYTDFYISREELAIEGLTYLLDELKKPSIRTMLRNELTGEIYIIAAGVRKDSTKKDSKVGIYLNDTESLAKSMYQAEQLRQAIEDREINKEFGHFVGCIRQIGRTGKYKKLAAAFGAKSKRRRRLNYSEIPIYLRWLHEYHPEYGTINVLGSTLTARGVRVVIEFENDTEHFLKQHKDASVTPCYIFDFSDCQDYKSCVKAALHYGPDIDLEIPGKSYDVLDNESANRAFNNCRDDIKDYIDNDLADMLKIKMYNNPWEIYTFDDFKKCSDIPKATKLIKMALIDYKEKLGPQCKTNRETLNLELAKCFLDNCIHTNNLKKYIAMTTELSKVLLGHYDD